VTPAQEELTSLVRDRLTAGAGNTDIVRELIEQGVETSRAWDLVGTLQEEARPVRRVRKPATGTMLKAAGAALLAASAGAFVWVWVAVELWYEIAFVAMGVGALCGLAVALSSRRRKRTPQRVMAVAGSLLAILVGKYATFVVILERTVTEKYGEFAGGAVTAFSEKTWGAFLESWDAVFHLYDGVFALLAWGLAWVLAGKTFRTTRRGRR
jgi:hypothetical protein